MSRFLVSVPHLGAARTYVLEGGNLNALKEAICACPVLGGKVDLTSSSFQILDKTFDEHVDISPEDTIPDLSKILVRPQVDREPQCASTSTEHIVANSMVASGSEDHENRLGVSFDLPSRSEDDGHTFMLPSLGSLHDSITTGSPISLAAFRKIVDIVFAEMKMITRSQDSWKVALRYRFKNQRRVLPSDGRVGENRTKFGSRRKGSEETATFCSYFARLTKIDPSPCIAKGINNIVKMAEMKHIPCEPSVMASFEKAREMSPERLRTRHILTVAALRILSFNVKEHNGLSSLFVQEEDPSVPASPCIVFSGGDVEETDLLHIKVDREKLFAVKNGEEGLAAVLSAYWLFNIQYDRKLFNTLVLERLFFGLTLSAL
ncbi:uncharacterized protein LOC119454471 [Dermacentor silvarum]|uniref:uncharacterized protein LOC119454471 n=1 Tax=Dermacentor silvarum TaxID=543639 RepID=UPI00189A7287|nr:uncharacterized protein LOC119454471 [Dermacentor silvarum]